MRALASPIVPFKLLYQVLKPGSHLSVTGVKLDILLGNANINYDPNRHITDKTRPVSVGVIALALTPLKGAKLNSLCRQ